MFPIQIIGILKLILFVIFFFTEMNAKTINEIGNKKIEKKLFLRPSILVYLISLNKKLLIYFIVSVKVF